MSLGGRRSESTAAKSKKTLKMEERLKKSIIENVPVQDREITIYTDLKVD